MFIIDLDILFGATIWFLEYKIQEAVFFAECFVTSNVCI